MFDDRLEAFMANVEKLWPRAELSREEVRIAVWSKIKGMGGSDLERVMLEHRRQEPDAARPKWKTILRKCHDLRRSTSHDKRTRFDELIHNYRSWQNTRGWAASMDEREIFRQHVLSQVKPFFFIGTETAKQPDHIDIELAKERLASEIDLYRRSFIDAKQDVPTWFDDIGVPDEWVRLKSPVGLAGVQDDSDIPF